MAVIKDFVQRHPRIFVAGVVVAIALAVFAVVWFQPQKLFIEETVDEALPTTSHQAETTESPATGKGQPSEANVLSSGSFQDLEHATTGMAEVIELSDGRRFLRLEDLSTSNGPDLRVYLSEIPVSDDWHAYGERFVDLGALKGNQGDQNYEIPKSADLSRYKSAVIWCRRFTVGFGVAGLS